MQSIRVVYKRLKIDYNLQPNRVTILTDIGNGRGLRLSSLVLTSHLGCREQAFTRR